jgi:signal transduction histidine kinase
LIKLENGFRQEGEAARLELTLSLRLDSALPTLAVDPLALERVFANLLSNALKCTPPGGRITVRSLLSGDAVVVTVENSGVGLSADEVQALFEKYHQGRHARAGEGAGLGLFIVKAFVEAHDGHIEVDSSPGQGARFSVVLPVESGAATDEAAPESEAKKLTAK